MIVGGKRQLIDFVRIEPAEHEWFVFTAVVIIETATYYDRRLPCIYGLSRKWLVDIGIRLRSLSGFATGSAVIATKAWPVFSVLSATGFR